MPTNDFLPFCSTDTGTNLLSQAAYAADPQLPIGNQTGVARSKLVNKALRQATYIASQVAQFLANQTGNDVLDDATPSEIQTSMLAAFKKPPTIQEFTASGTYTVPAHALYLRVRMVGGGGGGGGSSTASDGGTGGVGGDSTFGPAGATQVIAGGGAGGPGGTTAGGQHSAAGGTPTLGSVATGLTATGSDGGQVWNMIVNQYAEGGSGGCSALGGAGSGGSPGAVGTAGKANSGSGGGGNGCGSGNGQSGGGGASGAFVDVIIAGTLSATYAVVVGAAGTAGAAGTGGGIGSLGGSGRVEVTAYFG